MLESSSRTGPLLETTRSECLKADPGPCNTCFPIPVNPISSKRKDIYWNIVAKPTRHRNSSARPAQIPHAVQIPRSLRGVLQTSHIYVILTQILSDCLQLSYSGTLNKAFVHIVNRNAFAVIRSCFLATYHQRIGTVQKEGDFDLGLVIARSSTGQGKARNAQGITRPCLSLDPCPSIASSCPTLAR